MAVSGYLDYCYLEKKKKKKNPYFLKETRQLVLVSKEERLNAVAACSPQAPVFPPGLKCMKPKTSTIHLKLKFKSCQELDQSKAIRGPRRAQAPLFEAVRRTQLSGKQTHLKPWDTLAADQSLVHPNNVWVSLQINKN